MNKNNQKTKEAFTELLDVCTLITQTLQSYLKKISEKEKIH